MMPEEKRAVLNLLDVRVTITDWATCTTCEGRGKRKGGRGGVACPACRAMRRVPSLRIEGVVLDQLEIGGEEAAPPAASDAIPFRLEVAGGLSLVGGGSSDLVDEEGVVRSPPAGVEFRQPR